MDGIIITVLYVLFLFVVMWLFFIRPQKKRDEQVRQMQNNIKTGDSVLLNCGIYGKVVDIRNDNFIIEIGMNKGVLIPVKKQVVMRVEEPNLTVSKENKRVDLAKEEEYDDEK